MNSPGPRLSIILVDSDGCDLTLQCLRSIYENPPAPSFEVIVVDNQSQESCLLQIQSKYPETVTFSAPQPQGFAKNYNLGMKQARGEILMILNNDTLVHPGMLQTMLEALDNHPEVGMVGPKILSADGQIQIACARPLLSPARFVAVQLLLDAGFPTGMLWEFFDRKRIHHLKSGGVPCISGACMMLRKRDLLIVGYLDEAYEFYFEDVEWCHRFANHDFEVVYLPEAVLTHYGDQSLSRVREWAKKSEYQSAIHYFRQYYSFPRIKAWLVWAATALGYLLRAVGFMLLGWLTHKQSYAQIYWNLTKWILNLGAGQRKKN
jgi:GT2 family glycosyltransferase